jgi:hypothetical protein
MTKAIKQLLIRCHPDRNGGDHSLMERVYETLKHPSQAMDVIRRCRVCGVRIGGRRTCRMHRYTRTAIAALWLIILPVFGGDQKVAKTIPARLEWTVTTNFAAAYQSRTLMAWTGDKDPNVTTYYETGPIQSNLVAYVEWKGKTFCVVVETICIGTVHRSYTMSESVRVYK